MIRSLLLLGAVGATLTAAAGARPAPVVAPKPSAPLTPAPAERVLVETFERFSTNRKWPSHWPAADESYSQSSFGFSALRRKYDRRAIQVDRSPAFGIRASSVIALPAGDHHLLLRARSGGSLRFDGRVIAETPFYSISSSGHGTVRDWRVVKEAGVRPLQIGDHETLAEFTTDGAPIEVRLELYVGGGFKLRPELGETGVFVRRKVDATFKLLGHGIDVPLTDAGWLDFAARQRSDLLVLNAARRREVGGDEDAYWRQRHETARRIWYAEASTPVPDARAVGSSDHPIDRFVDARLAALGIEPTAEIDDHAFLRRVTLDLIGTIPTPQQIEAFSADAEPGRRARHVDRLLEHPGWADHWVSYWQDALGENPNLINPTLNNTGPFRWWLHESFAENKPFDRFATELIRMEGSSHFGGPGGFEMATQNDVPMAAKAHVIGQALLGVDFSCARCHDSPTSDLKQADLFGLAAMLKRGPQEVPATSSVPPNDDPNHIALVQVTLKPGTKVEPSWTLADLSPLDRVVPEDLQPSDERERFAALVTWPQNERFAHVIVNRVWKRYFGRGLVEPVQNWGSAEPLDAALLDYLSREFVVSGYDLRRLARTILTSEAYQRRPVANPSSEAAGLLPVRRRMTAEQLLDSMFVACGKRLSTGELAIDADGAREYTISLNLGRPLRAWEFTSLSNERDRPSLSLPRAQPFVTFLEAFGWQGARQSSIASRDEEPNVLQPGLVAGGVVAKRFTRLSDDSAFTDLALSAETPDALADRTISRGLGRPASPAELVLFTDHLREGFADRAVSAEPTPFREYTQTHVSWSNQHDPRSTQLQEALAEEVTAGDPPTERLRPDWRERYEDLLWALLNTPEFMFLP